MRKRLLPFLLSTLVLVIGGASSDSLVARTAEPVRIVAIASIVLG